MGTNVTFDILANDRASSKFSTFANNVDHSTGTLAKFGNVAKTAAKAGLVATGVGAVFAAKGLFDMAKAAAEDETAQIKLATTLKNTTGATDKQIESVERWISAQGMALGVADDDLRPAMQRLAEATGDVAKAQDLASLAMDVSAGTGRSLKTVSEALLRAHNGSVSGLSRYGIATKNAKGETLDFDQVVARMSKTFEGQAAKSADTAAGKFGRLKVILSETGEEIGAKLLPYAEDIADTFLKDGVPAIEAFGDKAGPVFRSMVDGAEDLWHAVEPAVDEIVEAFGHLVEEGGGAGDMFDDKLIPAVRTTAELIGDLVDFVDNLPGPVKDLGVEVGLAAIAFNLMSGGVAKAKGGLSGLIGQAATAETRMVALKSAAAGVAGVAGMLAIAKSTQEANDGLSVLERTMGGALLGFAAGGPIGAAVGGTAALATGFGDLQGAMYDWLDVADPAEVEAKQIADQQNAAAVATERHDTALRGLTATLDAGRNTAASLAPAYANLVGELEANGVTADTATRQWRLLGISQRTVAQASLGNADAIHRVNKAYHSAPLNKRIINEHTLKDAIDNTTVTNRRAITQERIRLRLTQEWGGKLKAFPKEARSAIRLDGVQPTIRGIAKVTSEYKGIDKKDIKTLLEVTGVDASVADVRRVQKDLDETGRRKPKPEINLLGANPALADINQVENGLVNLNGNRADTWIYTHHVDTYDRGHGGNNGGNDDPSGRTVPEVGRQMAELARVEKGKTGRAFHGIGAGIVNALVHGLNSGNANQAESAVDRMMQAIKKAVDDKKITEAAAKRMRATVKAMDREAAQGRAAIQKRFEFASSLRESFKSELGLGGILESEEFSGIGSITAGAQSLATRLRSFAVQLRELRAEGMPKGLISEIASLGSVQGSEAAAAILSGAESEQNALAQAFNDYQSAAGVASNAAANAVHGTVRDIKQEFHVTVNLHGKGNAKDDGREIEQALIRWSRQLGRPLQIPVA